MIKKTDAVQLHSICFLWVSNVGFKSLVSYYVKPHAHAVKVLAKLTYCG